MMPYIILCSDGSQAVSGTVGDYRERSCTLPEGNVRTIRLKTSHPCSVHDDEIVKWDETCICGLLKNLCRETSQFRHSSIIT
jgi:hypothetical protein